MVMALSQLGALIWKLCNAHTKQTHKNHWMLTGQSMQLEVICKRPCPAAVRCALTASCTCSGVIMPGGTLTGYSCCVVSSIHIARMSYFKFWTSGDAYFGNHVFIAVLYRSTGFPSEPPALFGRKWRILKDFLHPARTSWAAGFTRTGGVQFWFSPWILLWSEHVKHPLFTCF